MGLAVVVTAMDGTGYLSNLWPSDWWNV